MEELRDTIVIVGNPDEKLKKLLAKLGYKLESPDEKRPLNHILERTVVDLVLIDVASVPESMELVEHLRKDEPSKKIPLVLCGLRPMQAYELKQKSYDRMELIDGTAPIATISMKIATQLRLRKMAGADSLAANVADVNAMLRDLHTRFKKELEEARKIQVGLLPASLPKSDKYEIAVTYQPLEEVGGDWYYVQQQPSGGISFQIADVTGHGLSAAFICSMTKLALTAAKREAPHELLEQMNLLLAPQLPEERFVTFAGALYEPDTGAMSFARAGHPPAVLYKASSQEFQELKGKGFALGIMPDGTYEAISAKLEVGDVFVLYTDGLTEAQNRSLELFGTPRIVKAIKEAEAGAGAAQIMQKILADFTAFSEGRLLKDDVTLVVLKRTK